MYTASATPPPTHPPIWLEAAYKWNIASSQERCWFRVDLIQGLQQAAMVNLAVLVCAELCWAREVADWVKACLSIQLELSSSPWSDSGLNEGADDVCVRVCMCVSVYVCLCGIRLGRGVFRDIINISLPCVVTLLELDIISQSGRAMCSGSSNDLNLL